MFNSNYQVATSIKTSRVRSAWEVKKERKPVVRQDSYESTTKVLTKGGEAGKVLDYEQLNIFYRHRSLCSARPQDPQEIS